MKQWKFAFGLHLLIPMGMGLLPGSVRAQQSIEKTFEVRTESEALLDLTAAAPGTSWLDSGKEAAALVISVDDRYHQDVILFGGTLPHTYSLMLGRLGSGTHTLRIAQNRKQSAINASAPEIMEAKISMLDRADPGFRAIAHAPILYARPDTIGRFTDTPLLEWYEILPGAVGTIIRYSIIFTNEDGGTQTNALMARWGRTTDIELIYEAHLDSRGEITSAVFQGKNHENFEFRGSKEADHPLFMVATDNNMFSDQERSEMRFALRPIPFDLSHASREEVMYRHPWTYRIMAEELQREKKINESIRAGQQIADPRHYLYIQAAVQQHDTAVSFAVKLRGEPKWYTSDVGISSYKIDRDGYFQTSVRLPAGTTMGMIERLAVRCDVAGDPRSWEEISRLEDARCELTALDRAFLLDKEYLPGPPLPVKVEGIELRFGEMIEVYEAAK